MATRKNSIGSSDFFSQLVPGPLIVPKGVEQYSSLNIDDYDYNHDKDADIKPLHAHLLDIKSVSNFGIFASYFALGFTAAFTRAPLQFYLIQNLNASSREFAMYNVTYRLPYSFKIVFGLLSDNVKLCGYRRKPWLAIGWIIFAASNLYLASLGTPSIMTTIFGVLIANCGWSLSEVCTDTLCVERATLEQQDIRGSLQSVGFIVYAVGKMVGAFSGSYVYSNTDSSRVNIDEVLQVNALLPTSMVFLFLWFLLEISRNDSVDKHWDQIMSLWRFVTLDAVWRPMIFLFMFSMLQVPNAAWYNFLVWGLDFQSSDLGYLTVATSIVGCVGYVTFKLFLFRTSWRLIMLATSVVSFIVSLLQVALILRYNVTLGLPDVVLAVGHDAVTELMDGLHALPKYIMFVMLCPLGMEGTYFATLSVMTSLAHTVSYQLGSELTNIWDISNKTLAADRFSGVLNLTVLISVIHIVPLGFIYLMPDNREEHQQVIDAGKSNIFGGLAFVCAFLFASLYIFLSLT